MFRSIVLPLVVIGFIQFSNASQFSYAQSPAGVNDRKGLTFSSPHNREHEAAGVFFAVCGGDDDRRDCNPYSGDTMCKIEQPILCFLDIDMPVPAALSRPEYWTGGVLALSSPVRGSRFTRISDANAYCAATFGKGWRVASFHDGSGWALKGYGLAPSDKTRFWVDIRDQPDGTCWSR